jgi:hypothetical protein
MRCLYAIPLWPAVARFLDDGRVDLDTNPTMAAAADGLCSVR